MSTILIANIGNRDVWVDEDAPIPGDVHPAWNEGASLRALGRTLREAAPDVLPHLHLPIIAKALHYARTETGAVDRVALIASDQSELPTVADRHLAQDTCAMAPIVARLLVERHDVKPDAVTHHVVRRNPADYGMMRGFFAELLPQLRDQHPDGAFYLELSGGTPAMTGMLLVVGADVFGLQARPLYVSPHQDEPFALDLGRRMVADSLRQVVREDVAIHAYHAAAETLRANRELLGEFAPVDVLLPILDYARQRINFNFDRADQALARIPSQDAPGDLEAAWSVLRPAEPWWLLHEVVHNAELRLRLGEYGDFAVRLFRFDEAARRHAALELGARFVDRDGDPDPNGPFVDPAWLANTPQVDRYLAEKDARRSDDGRVYATRYILDLLVAQLARMQRKTEPRTLLKRLGRINQLSAVRNSSFATHSFEGVTARRLARSFTGRPDALGTEEELGAIIETMKEACALATGEPVATANPFDRLNDLVVELLDA